MFSRKWVIYLFLLFLTSSLLGQEGNSSSLVGDGSKEDVNGKSSDVVDSKEFTDFVDKSDQDLSDSSGKGEVEDEAGVEVNLVSEGLDGVTFEVKFPEPIITEKDIDGEILHRVNIPTDGCVSSEGSPELPRQNVFIAIPPSSRVRIRFSVEDEIKYENVIPAPQPTITGNSELMGDGIPDTEYILDEEIYNSDSLFPDLNAKIISRGKIRGFEIIQVGVNPVIFDPANEDVYFYDEIKVEVDFLDVDSSRFSNYEPDGKGEEDFWYHFKNFVINGKTAVYFESDDTVYTTNDSGMTPFDLYDGNPTYKIYIKDQGIYKVTYNWLVNHSFNPDNIDPRTIKIYAGNHLDLPDYPSEFNLTSNTIEQIPIHIEGEEDGEFNVDDYILFYGYGTNFIDEDGEFNESYYTDYCVYWLTYGGEDGMRLTEVEGTPDGDTPLADYYRHYEHKEINGKYVMNLNYYDRCNTFPLEADHWMWSELSAVPGSPDSDSFSFNIYDIKPDSEFELSFMIQGYYSHYTDGLHHTLLYLNYPEDEDYLIYENESWQEFEYINPTVYLPYSLFTRDDNTLYIYEYADREETEASWVFFDYFEYNYLREFKALNDSLMFRSPDEMSGIVRYSVGPFNSSDIHLIDIKNNNLISGEVTEDEEGFNIQFQQEISEGGDRFIATSEDSIKTPVDMIVDRQSDLHADNSGADAIYIVYDDYYDEIQPLINHRRSEGYIIKCVRVEDIYDEYSRGQLDPVAIKTYIQNAYYNWSSPSPVYVSLVGDGYFIYKDNLGTIGDEYLYKNHTLNTVPAYYYRDENQFLTPSDNWYGCVEYDDETPDTYADLVITRIPAWDEQQVINFVDKSFKYDLQPQYDDWKIRSVFVADNDTTWEPGDFVDYSEEVINDYLPYGFYPERIYEDDMDFPEEYHGSDREYEDTMWRMTREILRPYLNENYEGIITQYEGHGSTRKWMGEGIFWDHGTHRDSPFYPDSLEMSKYDGEILLDAYSLDNNSMLPVVLQLSCSLGWFDYEVHTMSEKLVTMPDRGAIFATGESRLGIMSQHVTHKNFYDELFVDRVIPDEKPGVAMSFYFAKLWAESERIRQTMFGDPLLKLDVPIVKVYLNDLSGGIYTRGSEVNISGYTSDSDFDGTAVINLYDEVFYCDVYRQGIDNVYRKRLIGKTVVDVINGDFSADLFIPYETGNSQDDTTVWVQVYAWDEGRDKEAVLNEEWIFDVSGFSDTNDNTGPDITIKAGNENFMNGDAVPEECPIWINLWDESGIRLANEDGEDNGRGYEEPITMTITNQDNNTTEEIDLTKYYQPSQNDYKSGDIFYVVELEEGSSTIEVSAYDNVNNTSNTSIDVVVSQSPMLSEVLNCPNPVTDGETYFTFVSSSPIELVKVEIFTVSGRKIREIEEYNLQAGYNQIHWDGRDVNGKGLANGVYLYKIMAKYGGETATAFEKLIMMR